MDKDTLVEQIKQLQRSNPDAKQAWWSYAEQLGGGKDPQRHDLGTLQNFMEMYNEGGWGPTPSSPRNEGEGKGKGGGKDKGKGEGKGEKGKKGGTEWAPGYDKGGKGGGKKGDKGSWGPSGSGEGPKVTHTALVEFIKTGQRSSGTWKDAWRAYCAISGYNTFDPTAYDSTFIMGFIDYVAASAINLNGDGNGGWGHGWDGGDMWQQWEQMYSQPNWQPKRPHHDDWSSPPTKRARDSSPPPRQSEETKDAPPLNAADEAVKADCIERIKALQRTDPQGKEAWWRFCDTNVSGTKDPSKHDLFSLQQFLAEYEDAVESGEAGKFI